MKLLLLCKTIDSYRVSTSYVTCTFVVCVICYTYVPMYSLCELLKKYKQNKQGD